MAIQEVKNLCESTRMKLKEAITRLEIFLNHHSIAHLNGEQSEAMDEFYRGFLADMRHLLVFSEVAYEKLGISLRRPNFNREYAEKALHDVFHNCIIHFFHPKHESYSEDGRYAYTRQDTIRFRKRPTRAVRDITLELSVIFEELREDLAYYETSYMNTQKLLK